MQMAQEQALTQQTMGKMAERAAPEIVGQMMNQPIEEETV